MIMLRCPVDLFPLRNLSCPFGHKYRTIEGIPDLIPPGREIPETVKPFEELYERYDARYDKHRILFENEVKAIDALDIDRSSGIEIGVGTGRFAEALGIPVGIDPSINVLRLARRRGIFVIRALGELLPFGKDEFEYSLIAFTICFAKDPRNLLREAFRVSKNVVIAFVPRDSPRGEYYMRKDSPFYRVAKFYTFEEVKELVRERGEVRRIYSTLLSEPGVERPEEPIRGYHKGAGLVVLEASRKV